MTDRTQPDSLHVPHSRDESELITFHDEPLDEDKPARKHRRRWIVLGVLAAVAAMILIMFSPTLLRVMAQNGATLSMPEKVGQLTRDDSEAAKATANDLVAVLSASIDLDERAAAVYSNDDQTVMIFGGTTLLWNPEQELDSVLTLMEDKDEQGIHDLKEFDPGPLGGIMKCGLTEELSASAMAVCGWADHGSIALAMFPARTSEEAAVLMRDLRAAMLTR